MVLVGYTVPLQGQGCERARQVHVVLALRSNTTHLRLGEDQVIRPEIAGLAPFRSSLKYALRTRRIHTRRDAHRVGWPRRAGFGRYIDTSWHPRDRPARSGCPEHRTPSESDLGGSSGSWNRTRLSGSRPSSGCHGYRKRIAHSGAAERGLNPEHAPFRVVGELPGRPIRNRRGNGSDHSDCIHTGQREDGIPGRDVTLIARDQLGAR